MHRRSPRRSVMRGRKGKVCGARGRDALSAERTSHPLSPHSIPSFSPGALRGRGSVRRSLSDRTRIAGSSPAFAPLASPVPGRRAASSCGPGPTPFKISTAPGDGPSQAARTRLGPGFPTARFVRRASVSRARAFASRALGENLSRRPAAWRVRSGPRPVRGAPLRPDRRESAGVARRDADVPVLRSGKRIAGCGLGAEEDRGSCGARKSPFVFVATKAHPISPSALCRRVGAMKKSAR